MNALLVCFVFVVLSGAEEVWQQPGAVQRIMEQAESGVAEGQYNAGLLRLYGSHGVQADRSAAVTWFLQAAKQGHSAAQTNLGMLFLENSEWVAAARWLQEAASTDADAQWMLGRMYYLGQVGAVGGRPDMRSAVKWYSKSAQQGNAKGQLNLAICYEYGLGGLPTDYKRAAELYTLARTGGDKEASFYLGVLHLYGRGVGQDLVKGAQMVQEAAAANVPAAMSTLGKLHTHGQGVEQDYRLALAWFTKASKTAPAKSPVWAEADQARRELSALLNKADKQMLDRAKEFF